MESAEERYLLDQLNMLRLSYERDAKPLIDRLATIRHMRVGTLSLEKREAAKWLKYNRLTATYDTPDGTSVAAELMDSAQCLADVMSISQIRADQRASGGPNKGSTDTVPSR